MQRKVYIQLTEAAKNVPAEVPGLRQCVTYLLDSLKTIEPKVLASIDAIEQKEVGKQGSFDQLVTFLLPSCPVLAKNVKAKGLGANVSGSEDSVLAKGGGTVNVGQSGVQLRWHEPSKFSKLTKAQKVELAE